MMEPIVIVVAGEAAPFRKKTMTWNAKDGRSGTHAYDEKKYSSWKDQARYTAQQVMNGRSPIAVPMRFELHVYFPIAQSASDKFKRRANIGLERPAKTPDCDNLMKAAGDAMTGIAIRDDKFIVENHVYKWYSDRPRVEITIQALDLGESATLFEQQRRA
jgi:Holliday junction resolvase RusA-like endonuclease